MSLRFLLIYTYGLSHLSFPTCYVGVLLHMHVCLRAGGEGRGSACPVLRLGSLACGVSRHDNNVNIMCIYMFYVQDIVFYKLLKRGVRNATKAFRVTSFSGGSIIRTAIHIFVQRFACTTCGNGACGLQNLAIFVEMPACVHSTSMQLIA